MLVQLPAEQSAALVLEDDVRFLKGWRPQLEACVHGMGEGRWDLFYLDCAHMEGWDFAHRGLQSASNVVRRRRARRPRRACTAIHASTRRHLPACAASLPVCLPTCLPARPPAHPPMQTACLHACLLADVQGRLSMITKEAARAALALVEADSVDVEDILLGTIHTHQGVHA